MWLSNGFWLVGSTPRHTTYMNSSIVLESMNREVHSYRNFSGETLLCDRDVQGSDQFAYQTGTLRLARAGEKFTIWFRKVTINAHAACIRVQCTYFVKIFVNRKI